MSELESILQGVPRTGPAPPPIEEEEETTVFQKKDTSELDTILSDVPKVEDSDPYGYGDQRLESHDPGVWEKLGRMLKDPEKEGAKAVQAITDAAMMNARNKADGVEGLVTPSMAIRLRKQIDKEGKLNPARAKLRGDMATIVKQNLQTGYAQVNLGLWGAKALSGDDTPETWDAIRKTQEAIPKEEEKPYPEGTAQEFAGSAAEMFPFLAESARHGGWRAIILAGGTWMIGTATGTPEFTYPLIPTMYAVGQTAGSLEFVGKVEAGLAYVDMMDYEDPETGEKVNPEVARAAAYGVGAINGLLEYAQLKTLVNTFPGGKKLLRGIINDTITETVESQVLHQLLGKTARKYPGMIVKETTQELAQESTNIVSEILARRVTNALDGTDLSDPEKAEIVNRLTETAKMSAQAFTVMGIPGPVLSAVSVTRQHKAAAKDAQERQGRVNKVIRASIIDQIRTVREQAQQKEIPLSEIDVTLAGVDPQTGETFEATASAEEAIKQNTQRQDTYSKIMECLTK